MTRLAVLVVCTAMLAAPASAAQAPAPPPAAPASPAPAAPPADKAAPRRSALEPQGYTYNAEGRRDPFVSLIRGGTEQSGAAPGTRPAGLSGLLASEISLRGTYRGRDGGWVGMVQGVDGKTYLVRTGDKLLDGTVRTVTATDMVILVRVNDPLSLETQREVRKALRQATEGAK
jgi:hypothetical protein